MIGSGSSLREAMHAANRLGVSVEPVRRTGEIRFRHALWPRPITVNGRRKDAPRELTTHIHRLEVKNSTEKTQ